MVVLPSRTSRWYACRYHRTCRSSDLRENVSCVRWIACSWLALTGGGGLARVDVSDDNDIDMSLLLTAANRDRLAMMIT